MRNRLRNRAKASVFALALAFALLASMCVNAFAVDEQRSANRLRALGVLDGSLTYSDTISRANFVGMLFRALAYDTVSPSGDNHPTDIAGTQYEGQIAAAYDMGYLPDAATKFRPNDPAEFLWACKVLLRAAGYQSIIEKSGGTDTAYAVQANRLEISRGMSLGFTDALTVLDAAVMVDRFLDVDMMENLTTEYGVETRPTYRTALEENLKIREIEAYFISYDREYSKITVSYDGGVETYPLVCDVDPFTLDNGKLTIYLNDEDEVVYLDKGKGYTVLYDFVYAVNESDEDREYFPSNISSLTLKNADETYDLDDAIIEVNEQRTTGAVRPINMFVKLLVRNGKITKAAFYDLREGGITYHSGPEMVKFIYHGTNDNRFMIDRYEDVYAIVDGVRTNNMADIKPDMMLDYWVDESDGEYKTFFAVASTRTFTGRLDAIIGDGETIEIDGEEYHTDGPFGCWVYDYDTLNYRNDVSLKSYLGVRVTAFVDDNMNVRYIKPLKQEVNELEFYGVVLKAEEVGPLDNNRLKVFNLTPPAMEKSYPLADKLDLGSIPFEYAASVAGDLDGKGVFKFTLNKDYEIRKIEHIPYFSNVMEITDQFTTYSTPWIQGIYFGDATIFELYEKFGELQVQVTDYRAIASHNAINSASPVLMTCDYDLLNSPVPKVVMLTNVTNNFAMRNNSTGIVTNMTLRDDPDMGEVYDIMVGSTKLTVLRETAESKNVQVNSLLNYRGDVLGDENVIINSARLIKSGSLKDWPVDTYDLTKTSGTYYADRVLQRSNYYIQFLVDGAPTRVFGYYDYLVTYEIWQSADGRVRLSSADSKAYPMESVPLDRPVVFSLIQTETKGMHLCSAIYMER